MLSADATITAFDTRIGSSTLDVGAKACTTVTVPAVSESAEETWTLGAIIDPADTVQEFLEDNNTRSGGIIDVR